MKWFATSVNMIDDKDMMRLARECSIDIVLACGHWTVLLGKVAEYQSDGDLSALDDDSIEHWAHWKGEPGVFAKAVRQHLCKDSLVRSWEKWNGAAMRESKAAAERMQRLREKRRLEAEQRARDQEEADRRAAGKPKRRSSPKSEPRSRNVRRTFASNRNSDSDSDISSGTGVPEERAEPTPASSPDPVAQALVNDAEAALFGAASPSERVAIERVAATGDRATILVELWEMGTDARHLVRGRHCPSRVASLADVIRGTVDFAAKGRDYDADYLRGFVRRVVDRRPEPAPSTQPGVITHASQPMVQAEETPEQVAERRRRSNEAMAQYRAANRPAPVGDLVSTALQRMVS